ncbi:membrane protein insertion efficiency factor YidD [Blattabacterium cuenoti]|uniref:membrane protein insertion efficiency factor YidD n=1 Tax=Blattabacterium cuenoti TaxID=1653831 RepID=UPI00163C6A0B|nr:membrane protein insertion efficiency factor YidD [Blattabacterium cuenoti]
MKIIKGLILLIVIFYNKGISPWIGKYCRFVPSCSEYIMISIKKLNLSKAFFMIFKRIIKCHPFGKSGYDPI